MAKIVNIYEAKTHLSELVEEAAGGKEIIIAKAGTPRARLLPLPTAKKPRKPGGWEGKIWIADDFDAPLPPEILAGFYGEDEGSEAPPRHPRPPLVEGEQSSSGRGDEESDR